MPVLTETSSNGCTVGYLNGNWIDSADLTLSMSDRGFRQGVTAVERFRTYQSRIFQKDAHLDRWQQTIEALRIDGLPGSESIGSLLDELVHRNQQTVDAWQETGVTMIATPGVSAAARPTFALHLNPLDLKTIAARRREGQRLVLTNVRQPSPESWPRGIKVRSRIHYYLADKLAGDIASGALGILIDDDRSITETSVANVAIIESSQIYSPPDDRILGGVTQSVVEQLAKMQSLRWTKTAITTERLKRADEVLLMGTDGGIWFANQVDDSLMNNGQSGPIYRALRDSFDHLTAPAGESRSSEPLQ